MSELSMIKGRCLCGAVNIATSSINHHVAACHCNMCRKWGGAALLGVECNDGISFEGEEYIQVYNSSQWAERGFCKQCGTHLFYRLKDDNHYHIPAAIFDNAENFIFDTEVFIEEKPNYYSFANETKKMTGEELFSMFSS
ncbi:MAG: GFA family protein [Crocosphaera sp.]|nr:GFA family protein [Crocosphaera sp.]